MPKLDSLQRLLSPAKRKSKRSSQRTQAESEPFCATVSYLPPELWNLILRYATSSFSDSPRTVSFLSLTHSHCHLYQRLAHYRTTMHTKTVLTLVCKDWHAYAQDVLYEFVWISRATEARALARTLTGTGSGKFIKHLHIETPTLERCDPADLRTILECAPGLEVYSDYRSVRRNIYNEKCDSRSSPRELLSVLAHPNNSLRRLSWTNYDDISFHLHMSPMLETTAANLEFLELTFCSTHLHALASSSSVDCLLYTPDNITLTLPALRSLKVTLDNATFAVLATWTMPSLRNISVLSADFSYASSGFSHFFRVHGPKLNQLELGHSSSTIEEHYLTSPQPVSTNGSQPFSIPLAAWCPNLIEFICSADAEWNWQHPDWIAPHVLLPTHPSIQLIGIRDIDKRLREDSGAQSQQYFGLLEQMGSLLQRDAFPALRFIRDMSWESDKMRRGVYASESTARLGRFGMIGKKRRHAFEEEKLVVSRETVQVLRFWECVLVRCRAAGVWLEDYTGVNVTLRDLRRAEAGKGRRVEFAGGC